MVDKFKAGNLRVDNLIKRFLLLSLLMPALVATMLSASVSASPKIENWVTSNGARVFYVHAPELPMVDIRVVFDAGSARDGDLPGLSMVTNSLLTEGAGKWNADEIAERIESVGAELSIDSLRDMGVVSLRSLTEEKALNKAVATMAAVIAKPTFEQSALDRNIKALKIVLRQELQSPSEIASKAFFKAMYSDHPYAHPSTGTEASLSRYSTERLRQFHKKYYVAKNAVVAIVGDVERQQAGKLAQQIIGQLPMGERAAAIPSAKSLSFEKRNAIDFPSQQAHLYIGMPVVKRGDPDYFALYVGNHVLGGSGLVSRISKEIREERGLAYSAYSYFSPMRGEGPFIIGLQTKNSQVKEAEKVVLQTLEDYILKGPSAEELKRSKQNITGGFPLRVASNSNIVEYLAMIGFYDLPLDYLDTFVANINAITVDKIRDAFKRRLQTERFSTVVVGKVDEQ